MWVCSSYKCCTLQEEVVWVFTDLTPVATTTGIKKKPTDPFANSEQIHLHVSYTATLATKKLIIPNANIGCW